MLVMVKVETVLLRAAVLGLPTDVQPPPLVDVVQLRIPRKASDDQLHALITYTVLDSHF
jgi:hypothetical protein